MPQPLTIDFVSDIVCTWCAIGLSSLQLALSRLGDAVGRAARRASVRTESADGPRGRGDCRLSGQEIRAHA
ncbi:hypothetical protein BN2475_670032 [Paraburkholderia ribeironis]|uniref:DSBA oxidoreductase n=1 Tax=Paraburkholderia ribeironis TaxID=1247936 RepID=A0A1N7SGY5_9BURK|nr:hypothetical protein BN2475_670032 [Paraburkholderia ribeironis]